MLQEFPCSLVLDDGSTFSGSLFGAAQPSIGEVVFTTGLVGYPESFTDPSYHGQILVLTYPLIGNYGVPDDHITNTLRDHFESDRIHIAGVIVSTLSREPSHWTSASSLQDWLARNGIPGMENVDTRALTQHLRNHGTIGGRIIPQGMESVARDMSYSLVRAVADVSTAHAVVLTPDNASGLTIGVLDCGVKNNMLRLLMSLGVTVVRLPWDADPLAVSPKLDGLLVSNGPGDPKDVSKAVANLKATMDSGLPTFGICLGNQLMALAVGADTYKLPYGHRGQNQPCLEAGTSRCYITCQNHGYAVDEKTLPSDWEPWFSNANDGTNEGIRHKTKPFSAVQFHPEAHPGPEDLTDLVRSFVERVGA